MPSERPAKAIADRLLRISVCDASGSDKSALIDELQRGPRAHAFLVEAGFSPNADVSVIVVDAAADFLSEARRVAAMARTAGIRHVVLAVNMPSPTPADGAAFAVARSAFCDFASKLEFATAVAIPLTLAGSGSLDASGDVAWHSGPTLPAHLDALAADDHLPDEAPLDAPQPTERFAAHVTCLSDEELLPGRDYLLKLAGRELTATVTAIKYRLDVDTLRRLPARTLGRGEIGICTIATQEPVGLAETSDEADASRFVICDLQSGALIAAGSVDFALRRGMNVHWQPLTVTKVVRALHKDQQPCVVWFTGLSGAGKSTIANLVEGQLAIAGCHTYLLDGDNIRHGLNKDLGFTAVDRVENIRRVGEVARLFVDSGAIVLCSFISPFRAEREAVRSLLEDGEFIEIHVKASLEVCESRDPKGLYAKSRAGLLPNFTGIDSPYEAPENADLVLDTTSTSAAELAQHVVSLLQSRGVVATSHDELQSIAGL
jgi:bifunctional enzyme CysN/CysC